MRWSVAFALLGLAASGAIHLAAAGKDFGGRFAVQLVDDSIWGHCDMRVWVSDDRKGSVRTDCSWEDGPRQRKERKLTATEVESLRSLLKAADLFQGQLWGKDMRGIDMSLTGQVPNRV